MKSKGSTYKQDRRRPWKRTAHGKLGGMYGTWHDTQRETERQGTEGILLLLHGDAVRGGHGRHDSGGAGAAGPHPGPVDYHNLPGRADHGLLRAGRPRGRFPERRAGDGHGDVAAVPGEGQVHRAHHGGGLHQRGLRLLGKESCEHPAHPLRHVRLCPGPRRAVEQVHLYGVLRHQPGAPGDGAGVRAALRLEGEPADIHSGRDGDRLHPSRPLGTYGFHAHGL